MTPDSLPAMRLIDVNVHRDPSGFLVATSRHLPKLLAVATCAEELASDLPESICKACEAGFGTSYRAFALSIEGSLDGEWHRERWAILPENAAVGCGDADRARILARSGLAAIARTCG